MAEFSIPYTTPADYTYDDTKITVENGLAKLKLQNQLVTFDEDFEDDTDFTYDSDLAEFVGGKVQQKNQRPTDATFYASYNNSIDGTWGNGVLTGTPVGGASVSDGKLDLTGVNKYVDYSAIANADSQQTGCIRLKVIPNYSGIPSGTRMLFTIYKDVNATNEISLAHRDNGKFYLSMHDSNGDIINRDFSGAWNPTQGQEYEIELNWNITLGETRLFIDGIRVGNIFSGTGIRSSDLLGLRLGTNDRATAFSDIYINDFLVFSTVQHTSNYTPDWSNIKEYDYLASTVSLPEMEHTLPGSLTSYDESTTIENGSPRYTVQFGRSGDYLYWNGSDWVASDGSYAQASDQDTFNAHGDVLIQYVTGKKYGQIKIHFPDSNTQSDVSNLESKWYMDTGYPTTNPTIYKTNGDSIANIEEWLTFTETLGANNEGSIVYQLSEDAVTWKYWNGSAWVTAGVSDYNSVTVVNNNISDFPADEDKIYVKAIFISNGVQQVELDLNEIGYVINTNPTLYAGTNKNAIYNVAITPFSDATFSDSEGNIDKIEWKEEGGTYVEISQGAYSTLLEAVQAFSYTPTHSGSKTLYLKVTDTYDAYTEDSMNVNVNQVNVTVNIKDSSGNHLPGVTFDAGDSSESSIQNSPFSFTYDIGTWSATVSKTHFDSLTQSNTISISTTEVDFTMSRETRIDELKINVNAPRRYIFGDTFTLDGVIDTNLTSYKIRCEIYDTDENSIQLATSNSGGSNSQIEIINASTGEFVITVAKDLTDNFNKEATIEIEIENSSGQVRTIFKEDIVFEEENLTWSSPS